MCMKRTYLKLLEFLLSTSTINFRETKVKEKLTHVDHSQTPSIQPVCIYMREEVTGEYALKETQLRTLGLTGGKAVIRYFDSTVGK